MKKGVILRRFKVVYLFLFLFIIILFSASFVHSETPCNQSKNDLLTGRNSNCGPCEVCMGGEQGICKPSDEINIDFDQDGYTTKEEGCMCDINWNTENIDPDFTCDFDSAHLPLKNGGTMDLSTLVGRVAKKQFLDVWCFEDSNNNGIGDYASCTMCRNPGMIERVDDIDNDCSGHCQANSDTACKVSGSYIGDGGLNITSCTGPDKFCQMVDDNILINNVVCKGYNRAIKMGKYVETEQLIGDSQGGLPTVDPKKSDITIEFIPGNNNLFSSAKYSLRKFISYFTDYKEQLNYQLIITDLARESIFRTEGNSKARETENLPDSFIDSMRGELYGEPFKKWNNTKLGVEIIVNGKKQIVEPSPNLCGIVKSEGKCTSDCTECTLGNVMRSKSIWNWQDVCVPKDKCTDGVNNEGYADLTKVAPFKSFIPQVNEISKYDETGKSVSSFGLSKEPPVQVRLIDMDTPSCKFIDGVGASENSPPKYSSSVYKKSDITGNAYCTDQDGDGFCANSILFPDCDDNLADDMFQYAIRIGGSAGFTPVTPESVGWGKGVGGDTLSAWHVHPFAPKGSMSCFTGFDVDCNKDYVMGTAAELAFDGRPFDLDMTTGVERMPQDSFMVRLAANWWGKWDFSKNTGTGAMTSSDKNLDMFCYKGPIIIDDLRRYSQIIGYNELLLIPLAFIPPALPFVAFAGTVLSVVQASLSSVLVMNGLEDAYYLVQNNKELSAQQYMTLAFDSLSMVGSGVGAITGSRQVAKTVSAVDKEKSYLLTIPKKNRLTPVEEELAKANSKTSVDVPATGCFLNGTLVTLANGSLVNIVDLKVGQEVVAYDLENENAVNATITTTFIRNETKYRVIEYE